MSLSKEVLHFYRHVLRLTRLMKPNERGYYRFLAKKDIIANSEEGDEETIQSLLEDGRRQIPWIMKKTVPGYRPPSS